jgi:hypothetical protein
MAELDNTLAAAAVPLPPVLGFRLSCQDQRRQGGKKIGRGKDRAHRQEVGDPGGDRSFDTGSGGGNITGLSSWSPTRTV